MELSGCVCESVAGFIQCVSVDWIYHFVCEDVD
jgi:hypothetical protein